MWVWGFENHKWYESLKARVEDKWLEKTFVSCVISKTLLIFPLSQYLRDEELQMKEDIPSECKS